MCYRISAIDVKNMCSEKKNRRQYYKKYRFHVVSGIFLVVMILAFLFFYGAYVYYERLN